MPGHFEKRWHSLDQGPRKAERLALTKNAPKPVRKIIAVGVVPENLPPLDPSHDDMMIYGISWALSKTGGTLITIEIDAILYKKAVQNFKAAGLEAFIDARLADAHQLVKELDEPFDFVFLDADKDWYTQFKLPERCHLPGAQWI